MEGSFEDMDAVALVECGVVEDLGLAECVGEDDAIVVTVEAFVSGVSVREGAMGDFARIFEGVCVGEAWRGLGCDEGV